MKSHAVVRFWLFALSLVTIVAALSGCQNYDQLIEKDVACEAAWSDYQAQLQRRNDLTQNLVETVKAAANYESSTLQKITQARADATSIKLTGEDFTDPAKVAAFQAAQAKLSAGSLSRLLVSNENYPKLQASAQYTDLMKQLEGTENRILHAREQYNAAVRGYNTELRKIRGQAVNKVTGHPFKERVFFEATPESTTAPKVHF